MPKLSECLKGTLSAQITSSLIWSKIDPFDGRAPKHYNNVGDRETTKSIFRDCKGQSVRKRVRDHVRTGFGGSVVASIKVGDYTRVVCKHKI